MSQLRKLKQKAQKEYNSRIKRQKIVFSIFFVITIVISFTMLIVSAINNAPTLTTTIVSGSAWFIFDILFAFAIKNKWHFLFNECSGGLHCNYNSNETDSQRKKDNWRGNCFKFAVSVAVFLIHLVYFVLTFFDVNLGILYILFYFDFYNV